MAFPTSMTVSVSKGDKGEGSLAHTHRKEVLKKMSKEKQEAFLSKKGHTLLAIKNKQGELSNWSSPKCWCKSNSANLSFHKLKHTGFF